MEIYAVVAQYSDSATSVPVRPKIWGVWNDVGEAEAWMNLQPDEMFLEDGLTLEDVYVTELIGEA